MRCRDCGEGYIPKIGGLKQQDKVLGDYIVPGAEYEQCNGCGKILYSQSTIKAIELFEAKRKQRLLLQIPIGEFISAVETAQILGCTKQALSKHNRIKRGFIHFMKFKNQLLYLDKSVLLFKETGDGRCSLVPQKSKMKIITVAQNKHSWERYNVKSAISDALTVSTTRKNISYY